MSSKINYKKNDKNIKLNSFFLSFLDFYQHLNVILKILRMVQHFVLLQKQYQK